MAKEEEKLNKLLVSLFNSVLIAESKAVITEQFSDITENDMHIMEAIGLDEPKMVSDVAKILKVTAGTLTINMNSLEKKEYIERNRSDEDKRVVLVSLTEKGKKAFYHHRDFHRHMIKSAISGLSQEERIILVDCLAKLDKFFNDFQYP